MNCKYCKAELEANSSVCPRCGKDNLKDDLKALKIVALSLVCLVMVVLLGGMISYGTTGSFLPDWLVVTEEERFEKAMDEVVATMGQHKLTNRQFQLYYWLSAQNEEGDFDLTKDLSTQVKDKETGETWQAYFTEKAIDVWQEIMLLYDAAVAADFKLPEDYQKELDGMKAQLEYYVQIYVSQYGLDLEDVDDLVQMQYGSGTDFETYHDYTYHYWLGGLYWQEMIDNLEITDEQIESYFKENEESLKNDYPISITKDFGNLVDVRNIYITVGTKEVEKDDGTKEKVEDWEACLKAAQEILDKWLAGDKTADSFGALAAEHSKDKDSAANGGLYEDMYAGTFKDVDVRHILIFPQGATSSTITSQKFSDDAWKWAEDEARKILDTWLAGDKTEEAFGALANEHSNDQNGKVTNGGLYEDVYMGQMVKAFQDWCFDASRQPGDTGIVKTEYGYHIMYFVRADAAVDDWCFDESRQSGDCEIIKTDKGYQIMFFQDSDPAWYRYCRYGAKGQMGTEMLEALCEANPLTRHDDKIVIGTLG